MKVIYYIKTNLDRSLRKMIVSDQDLRRYGLKVDKSRKKGRIKGWASIVPVDRSAVRGSIKIDWRYEERILRCRINTRNENDPEPIFQMFKEYLRDNYNEHILDIIHHE